MLNTILPLLMFPSRALPKFTIQWYTDGVGKYIKQKGNGSKDNGIVKTQYCRNNERCLPTFAAWS